MIFSFSTALINLKAFSIKPIILNKVFILLKTYNDLISYV